MARRGEAIYKRKDGRWEARYVQEIRLDGTKKYGSIYGKSYLEVKEKRQEFLKKNEKIAPSFLTIDILIEEWLFSIRNQVKKSSYVKYQSLAHNHINNHLGNLRVRNLTTSTIIKFTDLQLHHGNKNSGPLTKKTVNDILLILKMALKYAKMTYNITIPHIPLLRDSKKEAATLDEQDVSRLIEYLSEDIDLIKFGILLALYTGMRIGEVCALKWTDVKENHIYVSKTLYRLSENGKTHLYYTDPKSSSSIRVIPIHQNLIPFIQQFRKTEGFILQKDNGKVIEPRLLQIKFKKIIHELNIEHATFHTLRHTFATRCIEVGFDVKTLSEILGHSDVKTTLNRYVHSSFNLKQKNMEKLYF